MRCHIRTFYWCCFRPSPSWNLIPSYFCCAFSWSHKVSFLVIWCFCLFILLLFIIGTWPSQTLYSRLLSANQCTSAIHWLISACPNSFPPFSAPSDSCPHIYTCCCHMSLLPTFLHSLPSCLTSSSFWPYHFSLLPLLFFPSLSSINYSFLFFTHFIYVWLDCSKWQKFC